MIKISPTPQDPSQWSNDKRAKSDRENRVQTHQPGGQEHRTRLCFPEYGWGIALLVLLVVFLLPFSSWLLHDMTPTSWHGLDATRENPVCDLEQCFGGCWLFCSSKVPFSVLQKQEK